MKGIDVSAHQGKIDWKKVKAAGIQFAILRAGFGNDVRQKDEYFDYNLKEAKANGIKVGVYWFSYAISKADAKKEADVCAKVLNGAKLDLPVFYDWEYDSMSYAQKNGVNPTKSQITDFCIAFLEQMKTHGYAVGNYANPDYLNSHLDQSRLKQYPLWLACYSTTKPTGYGETIWQYSESGKVNGIAGRVDMNEMADTAPLKETTTAKAEPEKYELKSGLNTYSYKKDGEKKFSAHFEAREFACMNDAGTVQSDSFIVNSKLVDLLEKLFTKLDCKSMVITSGYRTPAFSISIGGSATDQHTKGNAADIMCCGKDGKLIPSKKVCCTIEDMNHQGGCGLITDTATHVDVRGYKAWFDEAMDGGMTVFDSYYDHWGIKRATTETPSVDKKVSTSVKTVSVKTKAALNLRKEARTDADVLTVIPKGTAVNWVSDDGWGWSKVKYGSKTGWVINEYLKKDGLSTYKTGVCKGSNVNVRNKAATTGKVIKIIGKNTKFDVLCVLKNGWIHARMNGVEGYIYNDKAYITIK